MSLRSELARLFIGEDPRLRRLLGYWAATGVFYTVCMSIMWLLIRNGSVERTAGSRMIVLSMSWLVGCYGLIRASKVLRIMPSHLAVLQSLVALACNVAIYSLVDPLRGASLMVLPVVIVFCTFSLRPRETLLLCAFAICALGATMAWMVHHDPLRYRPQVEGVHFTLSAMSMIAVALLTGEMSKLRTRLKQQKEELLAAVATIRTLATIDELTSLVNRRHMNEVLVDEERRDTWRGQAVCIALLDIDFFKSVNDRYGHAGGDRVLRAFAGAARAGLRAGDVLARWGGEEFLLMLPNTALAEATQVMRRMAERIDAMRIAELDPELAITFSGGLVERAGGEPFTATILRADRALYAAKSSGRDRVVTG